MRLDLEKEYSNYEDYKSYIYGSIDVVGLMCPKSFFVQGDTKMYQELKPYAISLGSAFQEKLIFLRDYKADLKELTEPISPILLINHLMMQPRKKS